MKIVIASRKSDLARIQAHAVADALRAAHPALEVAFEFRESLGDKNLTDPLWKAPTKGVFTEDFTADLIDGRCDIVVHSWKDLPTEIRPHTAVVATLARADARDVLLVRRDWQSVPKMEGEGAAIFTVLSSSPRRAHNLAGFLPDALPLGRMAIAFESVRGNVQTRVRKLLESPHAHALVVAKAALDRLLTATASEFAPTRAFLREALDRCHAVVLPLSVDPGAAAQGALAIEARTDDERIRALLAPIHCAATFAAVEKERAVLRGYGGGCHQKIGIYVGPHPLGEIFSLRGLTDAGQNLDRFEINRTEGRGEPARYAADRAFPRLGEDPTFFAREALAVERPEGPTDFWVARAESLPTEWKIGPDDRVWASGLETWKRPAARGIWVSGSSDSLGEGHGQQLSELWGREPRFVKLSHADSEELLAGLAPASAPMPTLATYRLVPRPAEAAPELRDRDNFYWMSASAFERACELEPGLEARGQHACGPGKTAEFLPTRLRGSAKFFAFPSLSAWRKATIQEE